MKNNILPFLSQSEDLAISSYFQKFLWEFHSHNDDQRWVLFRNTARKGGIELLRILSRDHAHRIIFNASWNTHNSRLIHGLSKKIYQYLIQYQVEHVWRIQRAVNKVIFW